MSKRIGLKTVMESLQRKGKSEADKKIERVSKHMAREYIDRHIRNVKDTDNAANTKKE
jgi:hypothetical protein